MGLLLRDQGYPDRLPSRPEFGRYGQILCFDVKSEDLTLSRGTACVGVTPSLTPSDALHWASRANVESSFYSVLTWSSCCCIRRDVNGGLGFSTALLLGPELHDHGPAWNSSIPGCSMTTTRSNAAYCFSST
jgi:hypothetical protein